MNFPSFPQPNPGDIPEWQLGYFTIAGAIQPRQEGVAWGI